MVMNIRSKARLLIKKKYKNSDKRQLLKFVLGEDDKELVIKFIDDYNNSNDYEMLFEDYKIDSEIKNKFFEIFDDGKYPIIRVVGEDNFDEILKVSKEMRNAIRGQDIGGLG